MNTLTKPKASNPQEARALYEYKLAKKYPFQSLQGYDWKEMLPSNYGKFVQVGNEPVIRSITWDVALFFFHSTCLFMGERTYTFIHMIKERSHTIFRPLMFTDFSDAYRYAYAYGCRVIKQPKLELAILDFMTNDAEDVDLFVQTIDYGKSIHRTTKNSSDGRNTGGGVRFGRESIDG